MFTGIIYCKGKIKKIITTGKGKNIEIYSEKEITNIHNGMSIAINGVCLTVASFSGLRKFTADISKETIEKTTFKNIKHSQNINIELPLTIDKFLSGHLVLGHIDTIGEVVSFYVEKGNTLLEIKFPQKFFKYVVEKGSIAVDGVSLTAFDIKNNTFKVAIIPETMKQTIISEYKKTTQVNLEFDIIGKYVAKIFNKDVPE
jgi:riboflavin synthase